MWPTVPELRAHAHPEAVEAELRAQIDAALSAGIDVTHLDHHMGAALSPEFIDATVRIARDYRLPVLLPRDTAGYLAVLNMGPVDAAVLDEARRSAGPLAFADTFLMPLWWQDAPDPHAKIRQLLRAAGEGVTYLALHCSAGGDIGWIHPKDAHWRNSEHALFSQPTFVDELAGLGFEVSGTRAIRDRL
jgi:hypothetical protein